MTVHIDLSSDQFRRWVELFPDAVERALESIIPTIREMAQKLTPAFGSTGELAESLEVAREGFSLGLTWTAPYADVVEFGAEPHTIVPRRAKALKFMLNTGEIVYRKRVEHPGYEGKHFIQRVADVLTPVLQAYLEIQLEGIERGGG